MKEVLTLRVDGGVREKLDRLARIAERSRSYLAEEAIREYVEVNDWQLRAIEEGLREAGKGELIPHETIKAEWAKKRADLLDSPGEPRPR